MSMQVDRLKQQRIFWSGNYLNPNSHEYQTLEDESNYAVSAANIGQNGIIIVMKKVLSLVLSVRVMISRTYRICRSILRWP